MALSKTPSISVKDKKKDRQWQPEMLAVFPMNPNVMIDDLNEIQRFLLKIYISEVGHSEILPCIIDSIVSSYPKYLRVKELFETMEVYKHIGQAIYDQWRTHGLDVVYDLACGHGLLGVLLAFRFPKIQIVCVDREARIAFEYYLEIFRKFGMPLQNISFVETDINNVTIRQKSFLVCIHGCNEVTRETVMMARRTESCFAVMPCCIREGIYLERVNHTDDETRYALMVGTIAGLYNAYKITAIDSRISNRNLIILGK